jgi:hypothetical protein
VVDTIVSPPPEAAVSAVPPATFVDLPLPAPDSLEPIPPIDGLAPPLWQPTFVDVPPGVIDTEPAPAPIEATAPDPLFPIPELDPAEILPIEQTIRRSPLPAQDDESDRRLLVQIGVVLGTVYLAFLTVWFWATRLRWNPRT